MSLPSSHVRTAVFCLLGTLAFAACGDTGTDPDPIDDSEEEPTDPPGPYSLETSLDFGTVAEGNDLVIRVTALDLNSTDVDLSEVIAFNASSSGDCISVSTAGDEITATALRQPCSQDIVVTAENQSKTIEIRTYDLGSLDLGDGLIMGYTDSLSYQGWDGANGRFYHPVARRDGFYPVGSHARFGGVDLGGEIPMIVLRDVSPGGDQLALPTGYVRWNWIVPTFPPIVEQVQFYKVQCPTNFVALGDLFWRQDFGPPPDDAMVCVARDKVTPALVATTASYHDNGTGGSIDISTWRPAAAIETVTPLTRMALAPNTDVTCAGNDNNLACDPDEFWRLLIPVPAMSAGRDGSPLRLAGAGQLANEGEIFSGSVRIPFTALPTEDPFCEGVDDGSGGTIFPCGGTQPATLRVRDNVALSPFYFIERGEAYTLQSAENNTGSQPLRISWTVSNCFSESQSETFSRSVGVRVTASGTVNFGFGSGTTAVSISTQLGWTSSSSSSYESCEAVERSYDVPPGRGAGWAQIYSSWRARAETGRVVPGTLEAGQGASTLVEWVLPG